MGLITLEIGRHVSFLDHSPGKALDKDRCMSLSGHVREAAFTIGDEA